MEQTRDATALLADALDGMEIAQAVSLLSVLSPETDYLSADLPMHMLHPEITDAFRNACRETILLYPDKSVETMATFRSSTLGQEKIHVFMQADFSEIKPLTMDHGCGEAVEELSDLSKEKLQESLSTLISKCSGMMVLSQKSQNPTDLSANLILETVAHLVTERKGLRLAAAVLLGGKTDRAWLIRAYIAREGAALPTRRETFGDFLGRMDFLSAQMLRNRG